MRMYANLSTPSSTDKVHHLIVSKGRALLLVTKLTATTWTSVVQKRRDAALSNFTTVLWQEEWSRLWNSLVSINIPRMIYIAHIPATSST